MRFIQILNKITFFSRLVLDLFVWICVLITLADLTILLLKIYTQVTCLSPIQRVILFYTFVFFPRGKVLAAII